MPIHHDAARLSIARQAASLFLAKGVSATSGKDIAAASGVSERTVWRYFRTKESCVEPLLSQSTDRFIGTLRGWSRLISIEDHLAETFALLGQSDEHILDGVLIARLVAHLPREPDLQATWLMASHLAEQGLTEIIAARLDRSPEDFDIRLCAATVASAIRVVDEDISLGAIARGDVVTLADVVSRMAAAIRAAATVAFCDPRPRRELDQAPCTPAITEP